MNPTNPINILVTGGCGFIGTNLIKYLLEKGGYNIRIFDNLSVGRKEYIDQILNSTNSTDPTNPSVELIVGDIRNPQEIKQAAEGVDAIVHLAAYTGVRDSLADPQECYQVNALGTFNVLEACRKLGIDRFIFASSNAAVGEQPPPIHEEMVPRPISVYGATKLVGEALCSAYYHAYGIKAIALRFSNIYGPYMDHKTSVIANFIRRAKVGEPLIIYGDGRQTRDFCHVSDICHAIELALHYEPQPPAHPPSADNQDLVPNACDLVLQLGTGKETQIKDLALMIAELFVKEAGPQPEIRYEPPQAGDIRRNCSDIGRARETLDFEPEVGLEEGLREVWEW